MGGPRNRKGMSKEKTSTSSAEKASQPLPPDLEMVLGYYDLAEYHCSMKECTEAYLILFFAGQMHASSPFLHYWQAGVSLRIAYSAFEPKEFLIKHLCVACEAAHTATTISPYDIEFHRLYISILVEKSVLEMGNFGEAIHECKQVLSIREDMLVYEGRLCPDFKKEQILEAIRDLYNWMEVNQDKASGLTFPAINKDFYYKGIEGRRSKSIQNKSLMKENEQKIWRKSCWDSMSDEVKAEFLTVRYEDLRTFFLERPDKASLDPLLETFSSAVLSIKMRSWECFSCFHTFRDYISHMKHVTTSHVPLLLMPLKDMMPSNEFSTCLADTYTKTFLLLFDSAELVMHMCNGVATDDSFAPDLPKQLLPDPDSFITWLNVDGYCKGRRDFREVFKEILKQIEELDNDVQQLCFEKYMNLVIVKQAVAAVESICLEELKKEHEKPSVKGILETVKKKRISRDNSGSLIMIQSQILVISELIQNEQTLAQGAGVALTMEQLEAHVTSIFKRRKELLANECDNINLKILETIACFNQKVCELSKTCLVDNSTSLLPHLALFFKARLEDFVYAHALEQSEKNANMLISEEDKKNAIAESKPSICPKKKTNKKKRISKAAKILQKIHQQEADSGIMSSKNVGDPMEECSQLSHLEQPKMILQTDSYVEQEKKGEECLEHKRHLIEDIKENGTRQQKEESITSSNSKDEERNLIMTELDPESFPAIASQVVYGSNTVHQEETQFDLIPLEGCSKSYAAQILNMNWMIAANALNDSNDPLHPFVELYTSDDSSTIKSEFIPKDPLNDDEDIFFTMFESAVKQHTLSL